MTPFSAPVDDILFSLRHVARAEAVLPDWEYDLTAELLGHFASFAQGEIAPSDETGDREGCRLVAGRVRMPEGFGAVYAQLAEQGWQGLTLPVEHGGQGMDALTMAAVSEVFSGANQSLQMVTGLVPGAARTLMHFGSPEQQARYLPLLASGAWLSTMCLTEPGAGSDLSVVRTRAEPDGAAWRLSGEKIFISGGDQDMSEGILHLVLARTGSMEDGVKGLSLFLCPSAQDGQRNAVSVARIEEKMGLHASPTCQMVFENAHAELIGAQGQGLMAMFTMMNHARLDVALQGVAHAARGADIARRYAAERQQGRLPDGSPARLDQHGDVQRMIEEAQIAAIAGRGLCHIAMAALESGADEALVDFLTPICKAACTDAGILAADRAIQVLGGYGYLAEYRAEQNWRDARIAAIYEGANGIHAMTLATRLLRYKNGAAAQAFEAFVQAEAASACGETLARILPIWQGARAQVAAMADPGPVADAFLQLTAELAFQTVWSRIAAAADQAADPELMRRLCTRAQRLGQARAPMWAALIG
ncbi:MAG: acyl-CoA dehydrogenase family protein [Neomegalonema sp.]|nr:acyl-CoA dehydrogenase family protein [Neomegalonema sp.]